MSGIETKNKMNLRPAKANSSSRQRLSHGRRERGFSRLDLMAVMVGVGLLATWFGYSHLGERGRVVRCAHNLQILSDATQAFSNDHGSALPPAGIGEQSTTWDMQLSPYLKPSLAKSNSPSARRQLQTAVTPWFFCPADTILRGEHPRSYAMSGHDMKPENWPPGPDNTTGVGLWWGEGDALKLLGRETEKLEDLALVKLAWLPDPANTMLLSEYPSKENRMGSVWWIRVESVGQQSEVFKGQPNQLHHGRFNYLMADGHVELLTAFQTGGMDGHAGIWSIKKGD